MKRPNFKIQALAAAVFLAAAPLHAAGVGTTGGTFLKVGVGARSLGMAGASVATVWDPTSMYWNPAGLALMEKRGLTASYNLLFLDETQGFIGYGQPLPNGAGTFGVGVNYLQVSEIERRTGDTASPNGTFTNGNYAANVSYARKDVGVEGLAVGANVKFIRTVLDTFRKNAFAVDLGASHATTENLSLGLAISNLGSKLGPDKLPILIRPGAAYTLFEKKLTLALDVEAWVQDKRTYVDLGMEYWANRVLAVRAGYQFNRAQDKLGGATGLGAGMGFYHNGMSLDYAFVPFGDLGNTHRITLGCSF